MSEKRPLTPDFPEPPDDAIPTDDLTDRERDLLAHLTVLTIQRQLKPARSYDRVSRALASIADDGQVNLIGTATDVWVVIVGRPLVHAARDWLRWHARMVERHEARN